jgi:hypothetical protein
MNVKFPYVIRFWSDVGTEGYQIGMRFHAESVFLCFDLFIQAVQNRYCVCPAMFSSANYHDYHSRRQTLFDCINYLSLCIKIGIQIGMLAITGSEIIGPLWICPVRQCCSNPVHFMPGRSVGISSLEMACSTMSFKTDTLYARPICCHILTGGGPFGNVVQNRYTVYPADL